MRIKYFGALILLILGVFSRSLAQTILNADNTANNTYELINSVLAPGYTAVETPDQTGGGHESGFGRHIAEVFDTDLSKNVFEFYIHVTPDKDVSTTSTDRQRVEIKTYASSPANLKGTLGEIVRYKWRFKIPVGFQPSSTFTHIHQVKAVDGDDSDPIFTLTVRKGTPNKLELIYVQDQFASNDKKVIINLSLLEGIWVEATETMTIGANGTYSMTINKVSDNTNLLSYSNNNIQTIRPDNSFIRPKWGIYRSIATPSDLRDESLRLSDISIQELTTLPLKLESFNVKMVQNEVQLNWKTSQESNLTHYSILKSVDGKLFNELIKIPANNFNSISNYNCIDKSPSFGANYYKIVAYNVNGGIDFTEMKSINVGNNPSLQFYPNPTIDNLHLSGLSPNDVIKINDTSGKMIKIFKYDNNDIFNVEDLKSGIYFLSVERSNKVFFSTKFLKK